MIIFGFLRLRNQTFSLNAGSGACHQSIAKRTRPTGCTGDTSRRFLPIKHSRISIRHLRACPCWLFNKWISCTNLALARSYHSRRDLSVKFWLVTAVFYSHLFLSFFEVISVYRLHRTLTCNHIFSIWSCECRSLSTFRANLFFFYFNFVFGAIILNKFLENVWFFKLFLLHYYLWLSGCLIHQRNTCMLYFTVTFYQWISDFGFTFSGWYLLWEDWFDF